MARRRVEFVQGEYYHIYNRGCNRELIFRSHENYRFLLRRVKHYLPEYQISVIAYCLMPNHYHFLLRQDGTQPISTLIQAIFNSYTKAFNKMHGRSGTLFEGPFQAVHIAEERYLVHLCRYIHRNPLDAGLVAHPADWLYSNYLEWVERRSGTLVDREFVRSRFPTPEAYEQFVMEYTPPKRITEVVQRLSLEASP